MRAPSNTLLRSKRDISVAFQKCGEGIPLLALACRGLAGSGSLRTRPSSNRLELALPESELSRGPRICAACAIPAMKWPHGSASLLMVR